MTPTLRPAADLDRPVLYEMHCLTMRSYIDVTWGWDEQWQRNDFQQRFERYSVSVIEVGAERRRGYVKVCDA